MFSNRVAVVLPAFNEALGIEKLLWRIARSLRGIHYSVIVIDDGSSDDTAAIAESLADRIPVRVIRHSVNSGYGAAIRTGLLAARSSADVVVTMDADDSHDPSLIPLMLQGLACGSDLIVASRFVPGGGEVGVPFHRRVLSHGAAVVFGTLLRVSGVRDYTSGYRAYSSSFLDEMIAIYGEQGFSREPGFTVGVELLLRAAEAGGAIAEMPLVLRYDRKESASKLRLGRTLADYWLLLRQVRRDARSGQRTTRPGGRRPDSARIATGIATDASVVVAAFGITFLAARSAGLEISPAVHAVLAALYAGVVGVCLAVAGLYSPRSSAPLLGHLQRVVQVLAAATATYFTLLFVVGFTPTPRAVVLVAVALAFGLIVGVRRMVITRRSVRRRRDPTAGARLLVYGAGAEGHRLAMQILETPLLDAQVVGFLDDTIRPGTIVHLGNETFPPPAIEPRVLGGRADLARVVAETRADELYVSPAIHLPDLEEIVSRAELLGLEVAVVPPLGLARLDHMQLDELGTLPVLRSRPDRRNGFSRAMKRALDVGTVLLLAPIALPIALLTAFAVALDGRPVLFRQTRIGRNGRPFTVLKFRTMHPDCNPYAESPGTQDDPRITPVGRLIRLAGIDELPQLINVLRGEMSLVGPRPEMPQIAAEYGRRERRRLAVPPGITGVWQLSPDRAGPIHETLEHDLYYLRRHGLSFDLLVLGETALFACRATARSLSASARSLSASARELFRRREAVDPENTPGEPATGYLLVVLDQRRRPDEPASWSQYIPRAASFAAEHPVKLVVAGTNESRIVELSGRLPRASAGRARNGNGSADAWDFEYVDYETPEDLHQLAGDAAVVFTDLGFVADQASRSGVPVVQVTDGGLRCRDHMGRPDRQGAAERVLHAFRGPNDGLRYA